MGEPKERIEQIKDKLSPEGRKLIVEAERRLEAGEGVRAIQELGVRARGLSRSDFAGFLEYVPLAGELHRVG